MILKRCYQSDDSVTRLILGQLVVVERGVSLKAPSCDRGHILVQYLSRSHKIETKTIKKGPNKEYHHSDTPQSQQILHMVPPPVLTYQNEVNE